MPAAPSDNALSCMNTEKRVFLFFARMLLPQLVSRICQRYIPPLMGGVYATPILFIQGFLCARRRKKLLIYPGLRALVSFPESFLPLSFLYFLFSRRRRAKDAIERTLKNKHKRSWRLSIAFYRREKHQWRLYKRGFPSRCDRPLQPMR